MSKEASIGWLIVFGWFLYFNYCVAWMFGYIGIASFQFHQWISEITSDTQAFYLVVALYDTVWMFLIVFPVAMLVVAKTRSVWPYIFGGVLLSFLFQYRLVLSDLEMIRFFATTPIAFSGVLNTLFMLPLCVFMAKQLVRGPI